MKVLVIPTWFPNGEDKLMGIYHKEFCEALSKKVDVDMLYIDRQRLNAPFKYLMMPKNEVIKENGYNVYLKKMLDVHKISEDFQLKRYVKTLEKLFIKYIKTNGKPDIIHAQVTLPGGYAACKIGVKYHIPVVVTEHASYFERFFEGRNKQYGEFVLNNAYFTTVSEYMAKIIRAKGYKCDVLPNLVDVDSFNYARDKVEGLRLVTVSALRQGKKIDSIIEALKYIILENKNIDAKLTIIGDGFWEDYYKNRCLTLHMDKYVDFVGRKTKKEIAKILKEHNIFVIASAKETFCIPGVEALASGMPVVSSKCLGPEEYVNEKCGKLFEVGDITAMKKAILEVYQNLDKYKVDDLRKEAEKYSDRTVINKAIKIYEELLK